MKKVVLAILTLLTLSCSKEQKIEFSLKGKTKGFKDGSIIYLNYHNTVPDSAIVNNNTFSFNTKLINTPVNVSLQTKDFKNYKAFWAENKPMTFDASKTSFTNAIIKGSKSEDLSFSLRQKIDTLSGNEKQKLEMKFIKENPNSIVSASILSLNSAAWGKERTKELYEQLSIKNKNSEFGKEVLRYIELNKEPKIGEQFADFVSENPNGELKKLSDVKGKAVLLEFWASWCLPCRKENPNLVKTYEKFNPKGFEIFAVSLDQDKESWLKAIKKDNLNWEHVSDLKVFKNEASLIYGVNDIPDNFLIDENGIIIARNLRGEELNNKLNEILN